MLDVTIEQHRLATAISAALSVAGKVVPNQPATSGVLLRAAKAGLTVTCTDLMLTSSELLESRVDTTIDKDGVALVPARHVLQAVKSLPAGPVRLRGLENQWLQINAKRSEFKLMGTPATDFPDLQVPPGKGWTPTPAPALLGLIKATIASVSTDEARVNLNGLLLESTGKRATAVSTDGHRLTKLVADLAGPTLERGVILPRSGVKALQGMLEGAKAGSIELAVNNGHLFARCGGRTLTMKLHNVVFPPYEQVIPRDFRRRAVVDRVELTLMLQRAVTLAPEKTSTVRMSFGAKQKELSITADNPDLGVVNDAIDMEYAGDDLLAGFNAVYVLDALGVISTQKIVIEMQGELDPMAIRPFEGPDFVAVVMPMRI
jgi:DNA polymerase-3 subunit beta